MPEFRTNRKTGKVHPLTPASGKSYSSLEPKHRGHSSGIHSRVGSSALQVGTSDISINKGSNWRGLSAGRPESSFDKEQLEKGIKVELEHTSDREVARHIAMDHLTEHPDYYKELAKMESKLEASQPKVRTDVLGSIGTKADLNEKLVAAGYYYDHHIGETLQPGNEILYYKNDKGDTLQMTRVEMGRRPQNVSVPISEHMTLVRTAGTPNTYFIEPVKGSTTKLDLRHGDRVKYVDRFGKVHRATIVMKSAGIANTWVANAGGAHGIPQLIDESNFAGFVGKRS